MSIEERAARKLAAGEPLSTGEAASLLKVDKGTVIRMCERHELAAKRKIGVGRYWEIDAAAVAALLPDADGQASSAS